MAGTVLASTIKHDVSSAATVFRDGGGNEIGQLCKAWCNYNGSTPGVRASFNVSSVTKVGTGEYTYNLTNSFVDANFSAASGARYSATVVRFHGPIIYATGSIRTLHQDASGTVYDSDFTTVSVFR